MNTQPKIRRSLASLQTQHKNKNSFQKKIRSFFSKVYERLEIGLFILLFVTLGIFLFTLNQKTEKYISLNSLLENPLPLFVSSKYPQISNNVPPNISAQEAIIVDDDSKVVLFGKNQTQPSQTASTAKIMSAFVALSYFKPDDILTVSSDNIEPVVMGLRSGEKITFQNLLYGMLLPSANDAAITIADNYPGGRQEFVKKMNIAAAEYHLNSMRFADPAGLDDTDFSSPIDLARLSSIVMKNNLFSKIVGTKFAVVSDATGTTSYPLYSINQLLGKYNVDGVKTGFTNIAGGVLVTSFVQNNHRIFIVVQKSLDRFLDTQKLIQYVWGTIHYKTPKQLL